MKKLVGWVLTLAVVAFAVAYFASPILAVKGLTEAARTGDEAELRRLVDFPALRDSLKDQARDVLNEEMRRRTGLHSDLVAGLGAALAPQIVGGAVEALVTPEAVSGMIINARSPGIPDPRPEGQLGRAARPEDPSEDVHQAWGYRNMDLFAVTLTHKDRPDRQLVLLLDRRGLFEWKLSGVEFSRVELEAE